MQNLKLTVDKGVANLIIYFGDHADEIHRPHPVKTDQAHVFVAPFGFYVDAYPDAVWRITQTDDPVVTE